MRFFLLHAANGEERGKKITSGAKTCGEKNCNNTQNAMEWLDWHLCDFPDGHISSQLWLILDYSTLQDGPLCTIKQRG